MGAVIRATMMTRMVTTAWANFLSAKIGASNIAAR